MIKMTVGILDLSESVYPCQEVINLGCYLKTKILGSDLRDGLVKEFVRGIGATITPHLRNIDRPQIHCNAYATTATTLE